MAASAAADSFIDLTYIPEMHTKVNCGFWTWFRAFAKQ
jgi:hypothetical protein